YGDYADWFWILGHLPAPIEVELDVACRPRRLTRTKTFFYHGTYFFFIHVKVIACVCCFFLLDWFFFRSLTLSILYFVILTFVSRIKLPVISDFLSTFPTDG